jgi:hypothetical protein
MPALLTPDEPIVKLDSACDNASNVCTITDKSSTLVFGCTSPSPSDTIVYFVLGEYQVVDLSEFSGTGDTGLAITFDATVVDRGFENTYTDLNMTIAGTQRLFDSFNSLQFTIHCISVINNVNIKRSPEITFYDGATAVPTPPLSSSVVAPTPTSTPTFAASPLLCRITMEPRDSIPLIIVVIVCFVVGLVIALAIAVSVLLCCKCLGKDGSKM